MDINVECKKMEAIFRIKNGMLRFSATVCFYIERESRIKIEISEYGIRKIKLESENDVRVVDLYSILLSLERLLLIFDGSFIPLETIVISGAATKEQYDSMTFHLITQRLKYYESNKIFSVKEDRIIMFEDVLTAELFSSWEELLEKMGVVNQMYLYAVSNCGFTNDVNCAFLIELSESLVELVDIPKQVEREYEGVLRPSLRAVIKTYGEDIFSKEMHNLENLLEYMVNTRVNIMHIKTKYKTPYFDGKEATLYLIKLSYLYRIVILCTLKIDPIYYQGRLKDRIKSVDEWNDIVDNLIAEMQ